MTKWGKKLKMGVKVGGVPCGPTCNKTTAVCMRGWSHLTSKV